MPLAQHIQDDVQRALAEDVGPGDLTAGLLKAADVQAYIVCRESAVLAGGAWLVETFAQLDGQVQVRMLVEDGASIAPGQRVCSLSGPVASILTGERTALNFLQTLSATATVTAEYVQAVAGTGVTILDTRKTLPGLRRAQKYAVLCGGGSNHRMALYDAILIKENHIAAAGSVKEALSLAQARGAGVEIEIEVESIAELEQALAAGGQRILLDNFSIEQLNQAVACNNGRARLEASGGISKETIRAVAETGVNDISVGALTKDIRAVDFSLLFEIP